MKRHWRTLFAMSLGLLFVLTSCGFPGMVSTSEQLPHVRANGQSASLPPIHFPQDEGAHNNLTEWWYYTGHMQSTDHAGHSHTYGFEFVVFQALRSNLPPIYVAHFAISDITRGQFHYDQRRLIEPPAAQKKATQGINVQLGDWSMQGINGNDHLAASMQNYALHLNLSGQKQAVLHNGNGLISLGSAGFSYYYSRTHMKVSGTVQDHGQTVPVTGLAWMDHQWGNFLAQGDGGWDWYSLQLQNDTEIMLYFIRAANGTITTTYGDVIDASGQSHQFSPRSIKTTVLAHWTSPITKATYPSGWRLAIDDAHWQGNVTITPVLKNQQLVTCQSTGNTYWEGAVTIQGQQRNQAIRGQGYMELTGYANTACNQSNG
jgi:predicted secreted hydrolase